MRQPKGQLREDILQVTSDLLMTAGDLSEVSIDAVVSRVGCTPPALYYYFASKEELLRAACRRDYELFAAAIEPSLPEPSDPVAELRLRGRAYVQWAIDHPRQYRVLFMTPLPFDRTEDLDPRSTPGLDGLIANLDRARTAGLLRIDDLLEATIVMWALVSGYASLAVNNPSIPRSLIDGGLEHAMAALTASYR